MTLTRSSTNLPQKHLCAPVLDLTGNGHPNTDRCLCVLLCCSFVSVRFHVALSACMHLRNFTSLDRHPVRHHLCNCVPLSLRVFALMPHNREARGRLVLASALGRGCNEGLLCSTPADSRNGSARSRFTRARGAWLSHGRHRRPRWTHPLTGDVAAVPIQAPPCAKLGTLATQHT